MKNREKKRSNLSSLVKKELLHEDSSLTDTTASLSASSLSSLGSIPKTIVTRTSEGSLKALVEEPLFVDPPKDETIELSKNKSLANPAIDEEQPNQSQEASGQNTPIASPKQVISKKDLVSGNIEMPVLEQEGEVTPKAKIRKRIAEKVSPQEESILPTAEPAQETTPLLKSQETSPTEDALQAQIGTPKRSNKTIKVNKNQSFASRFSPVDAMVNGLAKLSEPSAYKLPKETDDPVTKADFLRKEANKKNEDLYKSRMAATLLGGAYSFMIKDGVPSSIFFPVAMVASVAWLQVSRDSNALTELKDKHKEAVKETGVNVDGFNEPVPDMDKVDKAADSAYNLSYSVATLGVYASVKGNLAPALGLVTAATLMQAGAYTSKLMMERKNIENAHSPLESQQSGRSV